MGKKPFIFMAIGLFLIVGAFTFGVSEPTCGRGDTMSPGEVCVNKGTGDKQTYDEAKALQNREIKIAFPVVGTILIGYGVFTAVKRKRNPGWRATAAAGQPTGSQPHGDQSTP